ncbi:MAG: hypothetical protein MUF85_00035 [Patescibacteria group bacterium]|jgi:hypothetical protein|nr:hypothetical protein [Patescibacteria group bacterium]
MTMPNTYTDKNETGCCAVPNIKDWQDKIITIENQIFIRMHTKSFMFVPINMSSVMTKLNKFAIDHHANMPPQKAMILSRDLSPWKAEQLFAVNKNIEGFDMVVLNGNFATKVFEGPYNKVKNWYKELIEYAKTYNKDVGRIYFFYTTCPRCAKNYGKNFVIGMAEI